jgi:hypothetical protein
MLVENTCYAGPVAVFSKAAFMSNDRFITGLWIASLGLHSGMTVVLIGKKLLGRFPLFSAYAIFTLAASIANYFLYRFQNTYFYTYWLSEGVAVILGLGVVYEIFRQLFAPYPALRRLASMIFQWAVLVLILLGVIVVYFHTSIEQNRMAAAVMVVEEATRIVEVGLLMFLFAFSGAFGLHWRQSVFGMAVGLGVFTAVELVGVTMRSYWGATTAQIFAAVRGIAFNISLMIWLGYLLAPEAETVETEVPHRGQLEQWNQALTEFIYQ